MAMVALARGASLEKVLAECDGAIQIIFAERAEYLR